MMFTAMGMSALGTQIVAPYLVEGPFAVALAVIVLCTASLLLLPNAMRPDADSGALPQPVTAEE